MCALPEAVAAAGAPGRPSPAGGLSACWAALQKKPASEIDKFSAMFTEVQRVVDSKQLHPMIRTQYMRTAFQIPFDATVRVSLDTNLTMIKENPDAGPSCAEASRCRPWPCWWV